MNKALRFLLIIALIVNGNRVSAQSNSSAVIAGASVTALVIGGTMAISKAAMESYENKVRVEFLNQIYRDYPNSIFYIDFVDRRTETESEVMSTDVIPMKVIFMDENLRQTNRELGLIIVHGLKTNENGVTYTSLEYKLISEAEYKKGLLDLLSRVLKYPPVGSEIPVLKEVSRKEQNEIVYTDAGGYKSYFLSDTVDLKFFQFTSTGLEVGMVERTDGMLIPNGSRYAEGVKTFWTSISPYRPLDGYTCVTGSYDNEINWLWFGGGPFLILDGELHLMKYKMLNSINEFWLRSNTGFY